MANKTLQTAWSMIEFPFEKLGLMQSKIRRFGAVSLATGLFIWTFKPTAFFDEKGKPRANKIWALEGDVNAVPMDWFTFSGFLGALSILFV